MKKTNHILLSSILLIVLTLSNPIDTYAKVQTYYGPEHSSGTQMIAHATRTKYTYDSTDDDISYTHGNWKTINSFTCSKTTKKGQAYTLSHTVNTIYSVSISASIPFEFIEKIVPKKIEDIMKGSISVGVTKSISESTTCSSSGVLYKKGNVAELQIRNTTKKRVRIVKCQDQWQSISGEWKKSGKTYEKKIITTHTYPDHRVIEK
ncbi:hypothetical protein SAMN02745111_01526 [Eubacterium uniforme]|uniref:Uncharacterized protein n=1 Tax=Eubacterium uniforme TaxID=39495 RepID=A0A1T4VSY4_9FIRM|nr:hypothetical protein [Eubacterium uniforme]SKA68076.1 hypothetical protein SAMN02745111_01526 [Eubacterium uniforme]